MNLKLLSFLFLAAGLYFCFNSFQAVYATNTLNITGSIAGNVVVIDNPQILITDSPTNKVTKLDFYNSTSLLDTFIFSPAQEITTGIWTELVKSFGDTITVVTSYYEKATVVHFGVINVTNDYQASSTTGWTTSVRVERFTGLPVGETTQSFNLNVTNPTGDVRAKIYLADGLGELVHFTNVYDNDTANGWTSAVRATKFTGLPVGVNLTHVSLNSTVAAGNVIVKIYDTNGTDFHYNKVTNANDASHTAGWGAFIRTTKFTGLTVGANITKAGLYASSATGDVRMKVYQDDGSGGDPSTLLGESNSLTTQNGMYDYPLITPAVVPASGNVWVGFEASNPATNDLFYTGGGSANAYVAHVYGSGPSPFGTPTGTLTDNNWMEIAISDGTIIGLPKNLLGESADLPIGSTGIFYFPLNATIPASGSVWAAFEADNATLTLVEATPVFSGAAVSVLHTYGSGPNPFGSITNMTEAPWMRISYDSGSNRGPKTLLAESGSIVVNSSGIQSFPITTIVPANGILWAGFETDDINLGLKYSTGLVEGTQRTVVHAYGSGPNPFGLWINQTEAPFEQLAFGNITSSSTVTSNMLTFQPAYIPTYINNCGLSYCAEHLLNYTYYRSGDFTQLTLIVNIIPTPFDIECNIANGTFTQVGAWHNFTSISALNLTVNVVPNDNAYGVCYGSRPILSFMSQGSQSMIVTGANVLNGSFGVMLGVPIGTFVVVMFASLASQRTAPIYVVIVLAIIGIMSTISFFSLQSGIWAMVLIAGMLGLFVGRKVF